MRLLLLGLWLALIITPSNASPTPEHLYQSFIFDTQSQRWIDMPQLAVLASEKQVVLFGEWHGHPAIHLAQLELLVALEQQKHTWGLSMEQFARDKQAIIDDYLAGKMGEQSFKQKSEAWPNYNASYRPLLEYARANKTLVLAANAPQFIVRCVGQHGLSWLKEQNAETQALVAKDYLTDDEAYREDFEKHYSAHHSKDANFHFEAMLVWDETMAESLIQAQQIEKTWVHTVGSFHIKARQGLHARLRQRVPNLQIMSILPITPEDFHATSMDAQKNMGDYLLLVQALPTQWLEHETPPTHFSAPHSALESCSVNTKKEQEKAKRSK